ncbi:MAG: response regulator [Enhygromyxa sp.]
MPNINTILLVDDEPDIRTIAELSLSQVGGWKTILASSGVQALELASEHKPDLILLDVMMPEMDGVATFQKLAAQEDTREIPVIFMTARVQSHERERYVGFGAAGVIAKPFDPMRLPEDIRGILAQPVEQRGRNRLAALRRRYAEGLASKLEGLRAAIEFAYEAEPDNRKAAIEAAHRIAHTLHGTAGTYGHAEVSRAMAEIEAALERLRDGGHDEAACWQAVEDGLAAAASHTS